MERLSLWAARIRYGWGYLLRFGIGGALLLAAGFVALEYVPHFSTDEARRTIAAAIAPEPAIAAVPAEVTIPPVVSVQTQPSDPNMLPSALMPPEGAAIPPPSDLIGKIMENMDEHATRMEVTINREAEARLEGVKKTLETRLQAFREEMAARQQHLAKRMDVIQSAATPQLLATFFAEFGCLFEQHHCPTADLSADQMVAFFDRKMREDPEFQLLLSDEQLLDMLAMNRDTGRFKSASEIFRTN